MNKSIEIDWEYCYGIRALKHKFVYSNKHKAHIVYAPNGMMKTSFAKAIKHISGQTKEKPSDLVNPNNTTKFILSIDEQRARREEVFVVNGDDEIDASKSFVNFLASSDLKAKYDEIYQRLTAVKDSLITKLKSCSKSTDCEKELVEAFSMEGEDSVFNILERIYPDVQLGLPCFEFRYNDVFDNKGDVKAFLERYRENLEKYIESYNNLLRTSRLFRSIDGHTFGTYQASQLLQNLSDRNFFAVHHKLVLQDNTEVSSYEGLEQIVNAEQERILSDENLRAMFEQITKAIDKNTGLRDFKAVLEAHPEWISEMLNYEDFRRKVWLGFLAKVDVKPTLDEYMDTYRRNKSDLLRILQQAGEEQKRWSEIISLYNARFHVPIKVSIDNQRDVILKKEAAKLSFSYSIPGETPIPKEKKDLDRILSRGEKRAFIILQFLFEMEARKVEQQETIIVMDDIADSFDYQNKYAIVEYIKDLSESNLFYPLILTHNYDFYRTLCSRLGTVASWMAQRSPDGKVSFLDGLYRGDIFSNIFVGKDDDDKIFISMIPFVRNLIEYTEGISSDKYVTLTSCLHFKENTADILEKDIIEIFNHYTKGKGMKRIDNGRKILDIISVTANKIVAEKNIDPILIQNKIVLSIAIRHIAERYLYHKLIEGGETEEQLKVTGNQMGKWTGMYKKCQPSDPNRRIIEQVNMMTPELIHINSFMFEPLIDMSIEHLVRLYKDCQKYLITTS